MPYARARCWIHEDCLADIELSIACGPNPPDMLVLEADWAADGNYAYCWGDGGGLGDDDDWGDGHDSDGCGSGWGDGCGFGGDGWGDGIDIEADIEIVQVTRRDVPERTSW